MKKVLSILSVIILGIVVLSFNACNKADNEVNSNNNDLAFPYKLNCTPTPADEMAKVPVAPEYRLKAIPAVVNLSTPFVGDQGQEGSCTAWGSTYCGRSAEYQRVNGGTFTYSTNIFSPEFVFNQTTPDNNACAGLSTIKIALDFLKAKGACKWSTMPYTDASCKTLPNSTQTTEAANYKITGYSQVTLTTTAIKNQLAAGKVVIVGGPVNSAFMYLKNGAILGRFSGQQLGGHCYVLVGYDDAKGAFKFQNSWGTTWASAGYGWIAYKTATTWFWEAWVINN